MCLSSLIPGLAMLLVYAPSMTGNRLLISKSVQGRASGNIIADPQSSPLSTSHIRGTGGRNTLSTKACLTIPRQESQASGSTGTEHWGFGYQASKCLVITNQQPNN